MSEGPGATMVDIDNLDALYRELNPMDLTNWPMAIREAWPEIARVWLGENLQGLQARIERAL